MPITGGTRETSRSAMGRLLHLGARTTLLAIAMATAGCESARPAPTRPPDGWIAFVNADLGELAGIYVMHPDGSAKRRISTATGPGIDWSPDAQRLVFASNPGISVMNADGSGVTILAQAGEQPSWSPDGTQIVLAIRPNEPPGNDPPDEDEILRMKQMHIYVMQADGSGLRALTGGAVSDGWPSWSADGQDIAFDRSPLAAFAPEGCGSGICVMRADGSVPSSVPTDGHHAAWAPGGGAIGYASSSPDTRGIWVVTGEGWSPVNLVAELASALDAEFEFPTWSPDGMRIAFAHRPRQSGTDIYVVDRDGSNLTQLAADVDTVWGLTWR